MAPGSEATPCTRLLLLAHSLRRAAGWRAPKTAPESQPHRQKRHVLSRRRVDSARIAAGDVMRATASALGERISQPRCSQAHGTASSRPSRSPAATFASHQRPRCHARNSGISSAPKPAALDPSALSHSRWPQTVKLRHALGCCCWLTRDGVLPAGVRRKRPPRATSIAKNAVFRAEGESTAPVWQLPM